MKQKNLIQMNEVFVFGFNKIIAELLIFSRDTCFCPRG